MHGLYGLPDGVHFEQQRVPILTTFRRKTMKRKIIAEWKRQAGEVLARFGYTVTW
jgi:hypothetical protein